MSNRAGVLGSASETGPQPGPHAALVPWIALIVILLTTVVTYRGVTANDFALDDFHTQTREALSRLGGGR